MSDQFARRKVLYLEKRVARLEDAFTELLNGLHTAMQIQYTSFDCQECRCMGLPEDYECNNPDCPNGLYYENHQQIIHN